MKKRSDSLTNQELRAGVLGFGQKSMRKNYYPELRLRNEELEQYRALLDQARDAICLVDIESLRLIDVNDGAIRLFQLEINKDNPLPTLPQVVGKKSETTIRDWMSGKDETKQGSLELEVERTDSTGKQVFLLLSLSRATFGDKEHVVCVGHDISARRHAERALQKSHAELEQRVLERTSELVAVNKELETFAYTVSHDLRAPLRVINGFSEILMMECGKKLSKDEMVYLQHIQKSSHEMNGLIDGIMTLSHSTKGEFSQESIDISLMANAIIETLKTTNTEKINYKIRPEMQAKGDKRLIKNLLENLLGNAWKYSKTKENALIEFFSEKQNNGIVFIIKDNGVGFDMSKADRLFQPFKRLHTSSEFEGAGIGLATVQRIVQRHGGRIWAEAEVGLGATFYFTLTAS
ncbi:MAG: PAS domain S-box protein [Magnetococcales bacterium]|nr:PAS domain S-box protein [Magnetococcales bacterium]